MSLNSSNVPIQLHESDVPATAAKTPSPKPPIGKRLIYILSLPAWVFLGFMLAQAIVLAIVSGLQWAGVSFDAINPTIFNTTASAVIYALSIILVIGVPWWIKKRKTTRDDLGIQRLPSWMDIVWAPAGMVVYLILTTVVMALAMQFLTFVDYGQTQETGFAQVASQPEFILAFMLLPSMKILSVQSHEPTFPRLTCIFSSEFQSLKVS